MDANVHITTDNRAVFGYVRVSTNQQEVIRQEETIPSRLAGLPDGLANRSLLLFYDRGISAWSGTARPGFEEMLGRIRQGEAAALIVDTSSRLTRRGIREALSIFFDLKDTHTRLFTTQGREYTFDLVGIISLIVDAEADERYSSTLSHNVKTGQASLAKKGKWPYGPVPPGYRKNEDGFLEATGDLPLMTEMFDRFLAGESYRKIADFLTAQVSDEVLDRTKRGKIMRDWVRLLLKTETYLGVIPHNGTRYDEAPHPAAVSVETFERVQRRLERNAAENRRPPRSWPFAGIARCAACGRGMRTKVAGEGRYSYIRCTNQLCDAKDKAIPAPAFEASIVVHLASVAQTVGDLLERDPDWLAGDGDNAGPDRAKAGQTLRDAEARLQEMTALVKARAITTDDPDFLAAVNERDVAEAEYERLCRQGRSHRESLAALVAAIDTLAESAPLQRMHLDNVMVTRAESGRVVTEHQVQRVLDGWLRADFDTRRSVIETTLDKVAVGKEEATIHYKLGIPMPVTYCPCFTPVQRSETSALRDGGWGVVPVATAAS
jgi:DNA invertase Pin-like site-specific DNA recombinase